MAVFTPKVPPVVHESTPNVLIQAQIVAPLVAEDTTVIAPIVQPLAEPTLEAPIEVSPPPNITTNSPSAVIPYELTQSYSQSSKTHSEFSNSP